MAIYVIQEYVSNAVDRWTASSGMDLCEALTKAMTAGDIGTDLDVGSVIESARSHGGSDCDYIVEGDRMLDVRDVWACEWKPVIRSVAHRNGRTLLLIDGGHECAPPIVARVDYYGDGIETVIDESMTMLTIGGMAESVGIDGVRRMIALAIRMTACSEVVNEVCELADDWFYKNGFIDATGREYSINGSIQLAADLRERICDMLTDIDGVDVMDAERAATAVMGWLLEDWSGETAVCAEDVAAMLGIDADRMPRMEIAARYPDTEGI